MRGYGLKPELRKLHAAVEARSNDGVLGAVGNALYEALKNLRDGKYKGTMMGHGTLSPEYSAVLIEVEAAIKAYEEGR